MTVRRLTGLVGLVLALGACDDAATGTPPTLDAFLDATTADAGPDGTTPDVGRPDGQFVPRDAGRDAAADAAPDGAVEDAAPVDPGPDLGPDVGVPGERLGGLGEACPRGAELDCDPLVADQCVFVGENDVLPGVAAVCSTACDPDAEDSCGPTLCCFETAEGGRCLPAGFCAGAARGIGDACQRAADCPAEAPVCAIDDDTGDRFCTTGCAAAAACPDDFCCDANPGGRPSSAICKPAGLCPPACVVDADCPAVQYCDEGACLPRTFNCEVDLDCPLGERCVEGVCKGPTLRLGEDCDSGENECSEAAPVCIAHGEAGEQCTYNCTFSRDCPATYCCADLVGLGDPAGFYCTDNSDLCPRNLPCDDNDDCAIDQYCEQGLCFPRGPGDVPRGDSCEGPGDCSEDNNDCVFTFQNGVGRGERDAFENPGAGICSTPCRSGAQCLEGECCRVAVRAGSSVGTGYCVTGGICEPGGGGPGGGGDGRARCTNAASCDPARFDRCISDRFFGRVCAVGCAGGGACPEGYECNPRDEVCHPINVCASDDECGGGNRCVDDRCVEGERQCDDAADCGDPLNLRCFEGRCADRARPCAAAEDCDADEVCFDQQCELALRPCGGDDECRFGERCIDDVCQPFFLGFGDPCADSVEFACDPATAPICFVDPAVADGVCTAGCAYGSDCPGESVCIDRDGLGDPDFFLCAPDDLADRAADVPAHAPCAGDAACLAEDFCHRGACEDRGAGDQEPGGACEGPGDCNLMTADQCVVPREFGFGAGGVDGFADAMGGGTCTTACNTDADCGAGCCRHAVENDQPVGYCVAAAFCGDPVGGPGDSCFPGAHEECDPATTDACVFGPISEGTYCAQTCNDDADCPGTCCGEANGALYCLAAEDCP